LIGSAVDVLDPAEDLKAPGREMRPQKRKNGRMDRYGKSFGEKGESITPVLWRTSVGRSRWTSSCRSNSSRKKFGEETGATSVQKRGKQRSVTDDTDPSGITGTRPRNKGKRRKAGASNQAARTIPRPITKQNSTKTFSWQQEELTSVVEGR